jgi:hypothetical protein
VPSIAALVPLPLSVAEQHNDVAGGDALSETVTESRALSTSGEPGPVLDAEKCESMTAFTQRPSLGTYDEPAARPSIRVTLIIIGAALLLPMLGVLVYRQLGHRPAGSARTPR